MKFTGNYYSSPNSEIALIEMESLTREYYEKHKNSTSFNQQFYKFEWDNQQYLGDLFSTKVFNVAKEQVMSQSDFLKQIYPDFGWITDKLVGNDEIWPFFSASVEYKTKWEFLVAKGEEYFELKEIPKHSDKLVLILDSFANTFCRNMPITNNWPPAKRATKNDTARALKFYLNFGYIYLSTHQALRTDSKSSVHYHLTHDVEGNQTIIEDKAINKSDIIQRFDAARNALVSTRRGNIMQKANGIILPYEYDDLLRTAAKAFYREIGGYLISLNEFDRKYCLAKLQDMVSFAYRSSLETIGKLETPSIDDFDFHFTGFTNDYTVPWNHFNFIKSTQGQTKQRQFAADEKSYKILQEKLGHLPVGTYLTRTELKKTYKIDDPAYNKAIKEGWFEKENTKITKHKGKPRTYLKFLEGGMNPEYIQPEYEFENITFFPERSGKGTSSGRYGYDFQRDPWDDYSLDFDPDEHLEF